MASSTIICPYCNAKLRMSVSGQDETALRVKCRMCKKHFHPVVLFSANDGKNAPAPIAPLTTPAPAIESTRTSARLPNPTIAPPGETASPQARLPNPTTAPPAPTPNVDALPAFATESRLAAASYVSMSPTEPAMAYVETSAAVQSINGEAHADGPMVATETAPETGSRRKRQSGSRRAAAQRRLRARQKEKGQLPTMKWYEAILAVILVMGVVGGLVAAGMRLYHSEQPDRSPDPDAEADLIPIPLGMDLPHAPTPPPEPLARQLFGVWELHDDEDRQGGMEFRPNGTLSVFASQSGVEVPRFEGAWVVVRNDGTDLVIELGSDASGVGGHRLVIRLTCPDAFTVYETINDGVSLRETRRFVRAKAPTSAPVPPPRGRASRWNLRD